MLLEEYAIRHGLERTVEFEESLLKLLNELELRYPIDKTYEIESITLHIVDKNDPNTSIPLKVNIS